MDRLPVELVDLIVQGLEDGGRLYQYSTISHNFQQSIEGRTLRWLTVKMLELSDLNMMISKRPCRLYSIQDLFINILLPEYSEAKRYEPETYQEWQDNDLVFTDAMNVFLQTLKA
jgi:hypothetical protein